MNAKVDMALNIDVPFEEIVERIANRRSCRGCNAIYNVVFNPPKQEGICDKCGGELYQREDQKPEVVQNRLEVYKATADELIKYYSDKNVLRTEKAGDKAGRTSFDVAKEVEADLKKQKTQAFSRWITACGRIVLRFKLTGRKYPAEKRRTNTETS